MRFAIRAILTIGLLCLVFIGLNWPYYRTRVDYAIFPDAANIASLPEETQPDTIWIRRMGIEAPLVYINEKDEQSYQEALQNGVVHFTGTPEVGQFGNAYYFGHSSDYITSPGDYKAVFALLSNLQSGDIIEVTNASGRLYKYEVEKTLVVEPSDTSVLAQDNTKKQLTLQTSYPLGTALRRFIVVSQLVE